MTEITLHAYDYLDKLRKDSNYIKLVALNKEINNNPSKIVKEYVNVKEQYENVGAYGNYHPDFKELTSKFSKLKDEVYQTEIVKEYLLLSEKIEKQVTNFCNEMAKIISSNIPIENELGLFSLGGSCSGCK